MVGNLGQAEKEEREYQKFEGEYLFATRRIARAESEDDGKMAVVEDG